MPASPRQWNIDCCVDGNANIETVGNENGFFERTFGVSINHQNGLIFCQRRKFVSFLDCVSWYNLNVPKRYINIIDVE
jgi:hypothetical protein